MDCQLANRQDDDNDTTTASDSCKNKGEVCDGEGDKNNCCEGECKFSDTLGAFKCASGPEPTEPDNETTTKGVGYDGKECDGPGGVCFKASDCCSYFCDQDNNVCCTPNERDICNPEIGDSSCCGDLVCRPITRLTGVCVNLTPSSCQAPGKSCTNNEDCCFNMCEVKVNQTSGICCQDREGGACQVGNNDSCCGRLECGDNGRCFKPCAPENEGCATNDPCCPGLECTIDKKYYDPFIKACYPPETTTEATTESTTTATTSTTTSTAKTTKRRS